MIDFFSFRNSGKKFVSRELLECKNTEKYQFTNYTLAIERGFILP